MSPHPEFLPCAGRAGLNHCVARVLLVAVLAALGAAAGADVSNVTHLEFQLLEPARALAVAEDPGTGRRAIGMVGAVTGDSAATATALARCEHERARQQIEAACELLRLNHEVVTSGTAIRAAAARAHPLPLWRVQRGDRALYLAGSMHLLKATLHPLPPAWDASFAASDVLVVEIDPASMAAPDVAPLLRRLALLPGARTLREVLPAPVVGGLERWLAEQGHDYAAVSRSTPLMLATQVQLEAFTALGYQAEYGMEAWFLPRARARNMPVYELETPAEQLTALLDHPLDVQVAVLRDTLEQDADANRLLTEMVNAWWQGDIDTFTRYFEQQGGTSELAAQYAHALVQQRNHNMFSRIDALLDTAPVEFVLVGTAHMGGSTGLLATLEGSGARIQQLHNTPPATVTAAGTTSAAYASGRPTKLPSMPVGKPSRLTVLRSRQ